jgi:hypothetical protein
MKFAKNTVLRLHQPFLRLTIISAAGSKRRQTLVAHGGLSAATEAQQRQLKPGKVPESRRKRNAGSPLVPAIWGAVTPRREANSSLLRMRVVLRIFTILDGFANRSRCGRPPRRGWNGMGHVRNSPLLWKD